MNCQFVSWYFDIFYTLQFQLLTKLKQ